MGVKIKDLFNFLHLKLKEFQLISSAPPSDSAHLRANAKEYKTGLSSQFLQRIIKPLDNNNTIEPTETASARGATELPRIRVAGRGSIEESRSENGVALEAGTRRKGSSSNQQLLQEEGIGVSRVWVSRESRH